MSHIPIRTAVCDECGEWKQSWGYCEGVCLDCEEKAEAEEQKQDAKTARSDTLNERRAECVRRLWCAVCGAETQGRQWWNRDIGYGVCIPCGDECAAKDGYQESVLLYGNRGEHWGIA